MKKITIAVFIVALILSAACLAVQPAYDTGYSCASAEHMLVNNSDSQLLWSRAGITIYPNEFTPPMQGVGSKVFVVTGKDVEYGGSKILAIDTQSGNVLWHRDVVLPTDIIATNTQLYVGLYDKIEVLDPDTGNVVRVTELPRVGFIYNIFSAEANLYAFTKSGRWLTYNVDDGAYGLSEPYLPYVPFLVENGILYFDEAGAFRAKDINTQSILWEYPLTETIHAHPLFADNVIVIVAQIGSVSGIDKKTGNLLWKVDAHATSNIALSKSRLYFLTKDGYIKILDLNSGKEITKLEFSPASLEPDSPPSGNIIGAYNLWVDTDDDILTVSFGDSCQLAAFKVEIP